MKNIVQKRNFNIHTGLILLLLIIFNSCNKDRVMTTPSEKFIPEKSNAGVNDSTVIDVDGNIYPIKKLGSLLWMTENLKVTHFADNTPIPLIENDITWGLMVGNWDKYPKAYCYYYNNANGEKDIYGALYTWGAAMNGAESSYVCPSGVQGVCPDGWHLPSDNEWKKLLMHTGMSFDDACGWGNKGTNEGSKLAGSMGLWNTGELTSNDSLGATGFDGRPGGLRNDGWEQGAGEFHDLNKNAFWWSSTRGPDYSYNAIARSLQYATARVDRKVSMLTRGLSVRCVKMAEPETVTDVEGNVYPIVTIGYQSWMAENMRVTKYANGHSIPHETNNENWAYFNQTTKAYCFNTDDHWPPDSSYGALYTWAAAVGYDPDESDSHTQGICPDGWHIPTDEEWKTLEKEYSMSQTDADKTGFRDLHHHIGSLLSGPNSAWYDSHLENNESFGFSGFRAEGAGFRSHNDGVLKPMYVNAYWWSATESNPYMGWARNISTRNTKINRLDYQKSNGFSVRCLKNDNN